MKFKDLPQEYQDLVKNFNAYCYHPDLPTKIDTSFTPQGREFWSKVFAAKDETELPPISVRDYFDKDVNKQFDRCCGVTHTYIPWGNKWYCNGDYPALPVYYIRKNPNTGYVLHALYWSFFRLELYRPDKLGFVAELSWLGFYITIPLIYFEFSIAFPNPIAKWLHYSKLKKNQIFYHERFVTTNRE